jgi:hypothetical protein
VHLGVVLHRVEQVVQRVVGIAHGERGERGLCPAHVLRPDRLPQHLAARPAGGRVRRLHLTQNFAAAAAGLLDPPGVPVEHLEHRQRRALRRQLARHVVRGRQRHERVEPDVVLPAERARVGERRRGDEPAQLGPAAQLLHQHRQQPVGGRFLHQADEPLHVPEVQRRRLPLIGRRADEPLGTDRQLRRQRGAEAGDENAAADVRKEVAT